MLLGLLILFCLSQSARAEFYGDALSKRYHTSECSLKKNITARNQKVFTAEPEAAAKGYYPCALCIPPVGQDSLPVRQQRKMLSQPVTRGTFYIGDSVKKTFHYPWCPAVKSLRPQATVRFPNIEKAASSGFARCTECCPPMPPVKSLGSRLNETVPVGARKRSVPEKAGGNDI